MEPETKFYLSHGISRFFQFVLLIFIFLADLNHIQDDSQSKIIALETVLPAIVKTVLPTIYSFSAVLATVGFFLHLVALYKKRSALGELFPSICWFALWILHCFPDRGFVEREDLYVLRLAAATATLAACFICMATAMAIRKEFFNGTDAGLAATPINAESSDSKSICSGIKKPSAASSVQLHGINQNGRHGGMIQKRRHRRDNNSGRIGISATSRLDDITDADVRSDINYDRVKDDQFSSSGRLRNGKRFLAPSKFQPDAASRISDDEELCETASEFRPPTSVVDSISVCRSPSIVGSIFSARSSTIKDDDGASSVFSSISRRCPASTLFYPPSLARPKAATPKEAAPNEWKWKVTAGIVILLSLSTNAVVLGYLVMAGK